MNARIINDVAIIAGDILQKFVKDEAEAIKILNVV